MASGEWRLMLLLSLLMISFSNGLSTIALQHIPSNEGALLAAGSALWIAGLGALGPKGHSLSVRSVLGLLLGLAGVALLVWPREATPSGHFGWQSLMLVSSFSWALGTILYRNAAMPIGPVAFNAVLMLVGGSCRLSEGLDPKQFHFMHSVRCPDVGVDCSGYGEVMLRVQVVSRQLK